MIDRQHGYIVFECDGCGDTLETGEREWNDAMSEFRSESWRAFKDDDGWNHYCPSCNKAGA